VIPCLVNSFQRFGGTYYLHLQGRRSTIKRYKFFSTVKRFINVLGTRSMCYIYIWYADAVTPWHAAQYYIRSLSRNWCVCCIDINFNLFNTQQTSIILITFKVYRNSSCLVKWLLLVFHIQAASGLNLDSRVKLFWLRFFLWFYLTPARK
jgi:hypothetical protein